MFVNTKDTPGSRRFCACPFACKTRHRETYSFLTILNFIIISSFFPPVRAIFLSLSFRFQTALHAEYEHIIRTTAVVHWVLFCRCVVNNKGLTKKKNNTATIMEGKTAVSG